MLSTFDILRSLLLELSCWVSFRLSFARNWRFFTVIVPTTSRRTCTQPRIVELTRTWWAWCCGWCKLSRVGWKLELCFTWTWCTPAMNKFWSRFIRSPTSPNICGHSICRPIEMHRYRPRLSTLPTAQVPPARLLILLWLIVLMNRSRMNRRISSSRKKRTSSRTCGTKFATKASPGTLSW